MTESEEYGRRFCLMWDLEIIKDHFHMSILDLSKSVFNPRSKDTIVGTYLSCLEGRMRDIDISSKIFNSLTKEQSNAFYRLDMTQSL